MKEKIETYRGAVATWECDSNGHMNVMYYINKYELAGRNLFAHIGISKPFLKENNYGVAVLEQLINYYQEVFEDDVLYVQSSVLEVDNKVITVLHELTDGISHKVVGSAKIKVVIFNKGKRKAVVVPDNIRKALEAMI